MIVPLFVVGILVSATAADPDVGPDQFQQLIQAQYDGVRDLTAIVEGERRYVGSNRKFIQEAPELVRQTYQSAYAYRSDGAGLVDSYYRSPGADDAVRPFERKVISLLRGRVEKLASVPDLKQQRYDTNPGGPSAFAITGSYGRILFFWYLREIKDAKSLGYQFIGWEDVEGHRCLVVQFNMYADKSVEGDPVHRFWIDMERGAHPLKYELISGKDTEARVHRIVLESLPTEDKKQVWLPIRGEYQEFGRGSFLSTSPHFVETYSTVNGSIRINQGLADSIFSAKASVDVGGTEEMKNLRLLTLNVPKPLPEKSDAEAVKKNLDALLATADAQSERLDASQATGSDSDRSWIFRLALIAAGASILGLVYYSRKRMS